MENKKTKKCTLCKKEISTIYFSKCKRQKDGISMYCKQCSSKRYSQYVDNKKTICNGCNQEKRRADFAFRNGRKLRLCLICHENNEEINKPIRIQQRSAGLTPVEKEYAHYSKHFEATLSI